MKYTRIGGFTISRLTQYEYQIGEVQLDVPIKLSEEQKKELVEFVKYAFGEDGMLMGEVSFAQVTYQIGSKERKKEYGLKLLSEGREAEAKYYLKDEQ